MKKLSKLFAGGAVAILSMGMLAGCGNAEENEVVPTTDDVVTTDVIEDGDVTEDEDVVEPTVNEAAEAAYSIVIEDVQLPDHFTVGEEFVLELVAEVVDADGNLVEGPELEWHYLVSEGDVDWLAFADENLGFGGAVLSGTPIEAGTYTVNLNVSATVDGETISGNTVVVLEVTE